MDDRSPPTGKPTRSAILKERFDFFTRTWAGRLILLNALVFAYTTWRTGALLSPDTETLLALGAKDPVRLAHGEYWRLFTPMFLHIGVLHFAVNNYMLYVIGRQLESVLGGPWFLAIYLMSGVGGNVASALYSVNMSAGASSSLFGLLGAGLVLERRIGAKIRERAGKDVKVSRAYLMTVLMNLAIGAVVPIIDNSAHVGGLIAGTIMTFALLNLKSNQIQVRRPLRGYVAIGVLAAIVIAGGVVGSSPKFVRSRIAQAVARSTDPEDKIYHLSQAIELTPQDAALLVQRAVLLFAANEARFALHDIREALRNGASDQEIGAIATQLDASGQANNAWQVRKLMATREGSGAPSPLAPAPEATPI